MDNDKIAQIEYKLMIQRLKLYQKINQKITDKFNELEVGELQDYFDITSDIQTQIGEYFSRQKQANSIKETFRNKK